MFGWQYSDTDIFQGQDYHISDHSPRPLDDLDLIVGEAVEFIDEFVDFAVDGADLALELVALRGNKGVASGSCAKR